ncbi:tyrosine/serine/threonine protein phosphatase pps1 [Aspergillus nanangensis]|uniref:Tyrosine/serine/threonine protein phosphatase pps1 n=1 Tax=Aspergillus nanangensis TaxID=2582783 RepID=A0AAD4CM04_ASPNN|nr:tyrosine/serine/threonine protein phosphatase pps1 [Aspergillus nanangensis]
MATVVVQHQQQHTLQHSTPPPGGISPSLNLNRSSSPIPNKHLPICPPGPSPITSQTTSPTARDDTTTQPSSLLYPPDAFLRVSDSPPVYSIDAVALSAAVQHFASQPLPDPNLVFPWLHGLHPDNHLQLGFFTNRKRSLRRTPKCWRGLTIIKVGSDLTTARIKGAVAPEEILIPSRKEFPIVDPREGFSVRNFQIQTAKLAPLSDLIIYGDDRLTEKQLRDVAKGIATAQQHWRQMHDPEHLLPVYNTFVLSSSFSEVEKVAPELVAINSQGQLTGQVVDFFQWERFEMCDMSRASEFSKNVWQGPTPDYILRPGSCEPDSGEYFDLLIEANDLASIPGPRLLAKLDKELDDGPQRIEFPSSGSILLPSGENREVDDLVNTVRWIYYLANPDEPENHPDTDGDIPMATSSKKPRKVLIHCPDGYTESSLLVIAYMMFSEGIPAHDAWLKLHCEKKRNFFAYPSDVTFLSTVQTRLLHESPAANCHGITSFPDPPWFRHCDGSLPSRILPHMYLGNLSHANNPEMLWQLGIRRILSIGESVSWNSSEISKMGADNIMHITQVQDNGIDPLTQEFDRCLDFIRCGKLDGTATLVHCRVGVSRSATICIAEVMASYGLSFPRAYCFVRARRLNVIIQPHLRFVE